MRIIILILEVIILIALLPIPFPTAIFYIAFRKKILKALKEAVIFLKGKKEP